MLTFFRKIRKSLVDSSSVRKYLLYTIGEIALVVIGILMHYTAKRFGGNTSVSEPILIFN